MASMRSKTVSLRRFQVVVPAETMPDGDVTRRHDTVSLHVSQSAATGQR